VGKSVPSKALPSKANSYVPAALKRQQYLNFNSPLFALVRLATLYEQYHGPLLAYIGASAFGAIAATLLQGWQETWVREQETQIRQQLVHNLQTTYANSIATKYQSDANLLAETRQRLASNTKRGRGYVSRYMALPANAAPTVAQLQAQNQYSVQPMVRHLATGLNFGNTPAVGQTDPSESTPFVTTSPFRAIGHHRQTTNGPLVAGNAALVTSVLAGTGIGAALAYMLRWLKNQPHKLPLATQEVMECLVTSDLESTFLLRHKGMLLGVFALTALARTGQLLLNAAREVAVTQKNAATELQYQNG
jgi:hypothetical protein